jgi:glutamate--cysteine ligase
MEFLDLIIHNGLNKLILQGNFGLEKENLRSDYAGNLALTPHPEIFGDKAKHPYITTDFAEAQLEMVTPPFASSKEALDFIEALHDIISLELQDELLWPYSLPPILPQDDDLIQEAQFADPEITEYREYLANKYGKRKQLLSGVHFNFSFSDKFLHLLYCAQGGNYSYREFKDQIYLRIARYYFKYCWLVIYLTGANSIAHESYITPATPISNSFRNGANGYRNLDQFYVSYNSLHEYIADIKQAIASGKIIAAKEYYSQIRLKGSRQGPILDDLYHNGISYVEIRTLDLNPLTKIGITAESLEFIHLLLIYFLVAPDFFMTKEEYYLANQNQILAADASPNAAIYLYYSATQQIKLQDWGLQFLEEVYATLFQLGLSATQLQVIKNYKQGLSTTVFPPANSITQKIKTNGYANYFTALAKAYLEESKFNYHKFPGFADLELSTQILLKESIKRGLKFCFLDREDNFIELDNGINKERIKQATKTSLDNYATILAMENKLITKKLLAAAGIIVPAGESYINAEQALGDYLLWQNKAIVIKPNSTNFGLGVTIFKGAYTKLEYEAALRDAFSYASTVLIEEFMPGKEYRFFVIDGQAVAILQRDPANIIGDGVHDISQLVKLKNQDPLRGHGYKTPLECLKLGSSEINFLAQQNYSIHDIPSVGDKVYLRENSNISTGGDSIDVTDNIPKAYQRIAVKATAVVGAAVCGVDMLIRNIHNPYPENNYTLLELNFNPAIHIHTYPYQGKDRKIAQRLLQALRLIG